MTDAPAGPAPDAPAAPDARPRRRGRAWALAAVGVVAALLVGGGAVLLTRPAAPAATALELAGDLRTHDPALVVGDEGEPWYVFSTGDVRVGLGAPQIRRSTDGGRTWEDIGTVWEAGTRPRWVYEAVPGVENFWAPEVVEHDGTWYLYYAASTFGSNRSVIGLMTNTTLDPDDPAYAWVDRGEVISSTPGEDNWNAIDAGVVDVDGTPWMAFGSFWGGIQLIELAWPDGMPADPAAEPVTIASRIGSPNAIEAPYLAERDGWYYLFVSRDSCCQGSDSTYNMAVGRSRDVTGPYVDREGRDLAAGGGEPLLATRGDMVGPGGQSYSKGYLAFHWYDAAEGGDFRLGIRELAWDDEGWPVATTREEQEQVQDAG
ncbi:arabinan endo-1,5-alpha-L-arabinosidase [Cellulomonas iranensis]|uniref:Arabinan endo-1,5-alpha-L-arabinosidase n=2 Tax=Cellulomonas iranensis TaxID=76862 RepID=A0ABU0GLA0_9CELL|nr:arabinan endo-1,5-alpha-L-arabinosidase [Cellulomonas iranensis]MDQ0426134.1 arabinan endo-1,5-alpha-L-arabinosidase [Cellulomonas iranensis]